jgi:hypothetical protein
MLNSENKVRHNSRKNKEDRISSKMSPEQENL